MNTQNIPILLIIFNRPRKVKKLIQALAKIEPKKLYIVADGPRRGVPSDIEKCVKARETATNISWKCDVRTKFLDTNLRSRYNAVEYSAVIGIDWLFKDNEVGIILEDDCIPNSSFFTFCGELLEKYKNDKEVMHISGNNFQDGNIRGDGSYYFSLYSHSWGWATWKRAWEKFHPAIADMPNFIKENRIKDFPITKEAQNFWLKSYRSQKHWDSLWQYTIWHERGLSILPNQNLVTNIGFGNDATNTWDTNNALSNLPANTINKVIHSPDRHLNTKADDYTFRKIFHTSLTKKIMYRIRQLPKKLYTLTTRRQSS